MDNDGCERLIQRQPGNVWKVALTAATAGSLNAPQVVIGATEPVGQGERNEKLAFHQGALASAAVRTLSANDGEEGDIKQAGRSRVS